MKKQIITPYLFEGYLILSLNPEWIKVFNEIPKFSVTIEKDKKLHIVSEKQIDSTEIE